MPCPYIVSLMAEMTRRACSYISGSSNKMGVFALKNVGVVDFVVWIFFCNFVDCV